jgi:hypothetical protein
MLFCPVAKVLSLDVLPPCAGIRMPYLAAVAATGGEPLIRSSTKARGNTRSFTRPHLNRY